MIISCNTLSFSFWNCILKVVTVILWKSDSKVSITHQFWKFLGLFVNMRFVCKYEINTSQVFRILITCWNFYQTFQIVTLTKMSHVIIVHRIIHHHITSRQNIFKLRRVQVQVRGFMRSLLAIFLLKYHLNITTLCQPTKL